MGLFNIDGLNMPEVEQEPIGCYGKCKNDGTYAGIAPDFKRGSKGILSG